MSYYDDYVDDDVQASNTTTNSTIATDIFNPPFTSTGGALS
jgi:hypothetical protein